MKKLALVTRICAYFMSLSVAQAHSGHGVADSGGSIFHYLADHQGVTLTLIAVTLAVFAKKMALGRN